MIEEQDPNKANGSPYTTDDTNIPPGPVVCDKLRPQHRWTERYDCEDEDGDVCSTLSGWCHLRGGSERCELVDAGSDSIEHHATCILRVSRARIVFTYLLTDEDIHIMRSCADDIA